MRTIIRRLSSSNKSRTGIVSLVERSGQYDNEFNIWSEKYWSELGKQFNKSVDFPLPGQTGTIIEEMTNTNSTNTKSRENETHDSAQQYKNNTNTSKYNQYVNIQKSISQEYNKYNNHKTKQ